MLLWLGNFGKCYYGKWDLAISQPLKKWKKVEQQNISTYFHLLKTNLYIKISPRDQSNVSTLFPRCHIVISRFIWPKDIKPRVQAINKIYNNLIIRARMSYRNANNTFPPSLCVLEINQRFSANYKELRGNTISKDIT